LRQNVVRYCRCKIGDLRRFYATPWIPYSSDVDRRNVFASVYHRCVQGIAEVQQLLAAAERYCTEALRMAEQHGNPNSIAAALPASLIARIRYEPGRVEEAEAMLVDRLQLINAGTMLECVLSAYFAMVRVAAFRKNFDRAYTLLERAENLGTMHDWGGYGFISRKVGSAKLSWLTSISGVLPRNTSRWSIRHTSILRFGSSLSCIGTTDDAISILTSLRDDAERVHSHYFALRVAIALNVSARAGCRAND
jgi:LuxR family transcriptional regulator, maltose regulon positive regulatory protein